ncbi:DNA polymerase IV [Microbaculum marinum]|uniref:DNA polymerase IV n=1 Tax=Microbaculum marinum TaxID=1764581 RepID=A0AAW9S0P6_9HYPH
MPAVPAICLDCSAQPLEAGLRCPSCGGPRLIRHPELLSLSIAHIDCDAFYAAIEKRDDPSLADRPVIIGGGRRGVVSTACYIARINGVRSAMPMFKALKACPDAVVIRPNMQKYVAVGREVRGLMQELTPLVEPMSIDEAFLDLTGTEGVHKMAPAGTLVRFARRVEAEIGISVSIGLSHNKFLAKIASDLKKPRGFSVIGRAETMAFLKAKPVGTIFGVGTAMQNRLASDGIRLIGDLQSRSEADLARAYGSQGIRLSRLSRGLDDRLVSPNRAAKSVSSETTFNDDISDPEELNRILWGLSEKVSRRLKKADLSGRTITLKLKTAGFRILTRSQTVSAPTQLADRIFDAGRRMLLDAADGTRFRLIGIGVSEFGPEAPADLTDLIDPGPARRAAAERAVDAVRDRFGDAAVQRGIGFTSRPLKRQAD